MSAFSCWVHGCSYEDDALCQRDSMKMYLVQGYPNTLVCEACYRSASGGDLPMRPYFDHATDRAKNWDDSGLIWGLGWIDKIGFDQLASRLKQQRQGQ